MKKNKMLVGSILVFIAACISICTKVSTLISLLLQKDTFTQEFVSSFESSFSAAGGDLSSLGVNIESIATIMYGFELFFFALIIILSALNILFAAVVYKLSKLDNFDIINNGGKIKTFKALAIVGLILSGFIPFILYLIGVIMVSKNYKEIIIENRYASVE